MTVRNLEHLFLPRSIALIGASPERDSVGNILVENLLNGGFRGDLHFVNPRHRQIAGRTCFSRLSEIPEAPDLAVIATPPSTVPGVIKDLSDAGTRAAVVITAGIDSKTRQAMLEASRTECVRIVGPNCLGFWIPHLGINANFGRVVPPSGRLAFLSQSGALVGAVLDWASSRRIGFSAVVSMGDMADVDAGDLIDFLAADVATHAILLYLETIPAPRKFISAARSAARAKPVVLIKSGRTQGSAKAAATHTGALSGTDNVVDAALRRAGVLRVNDLEELFTAAETLTWLAPIEGNALKIVTNGGGAGVLAVDELEALGGSLAPLSDATAKRLDTFLPANWSRANPVDIIGDATAERYRKAVEIVLSETCADAALVMLCPTALTSPLDAANAVIEVVKAQRMQGSNLPVLTNWLGGVGVEDARNAFVAAGIPAYESPADAVRGFDYLWRHTKLQKALLRTPSIQVVDIDADREAALLTLGGVGNEGRELLTEPEAKAILTAYGIPTVPTQTVPDLDAAEAAARDLLADNNAVVLKILSRDITHKSDVGGVRLNLRSLTDVREAGSYMLARIAEAQPKARMDGFTVQPMIVRPKAYELILGVSEDRMFGPIILFGAGGVATEVLNDTAVGLPPLDSRFAQELIESTRIYQLLKGFRDRKPARVDAVVDALLRLSQLVVDQPCICELDINPLLADQDGVVALDARIRIDPEAIGARRPNPRLVIRPYPDQWETQIDTAIGRIILRPIRPEDEHLYGSFVARLAPEDVRSRFLAPRKEFSHEFIARFTQIDYARAMAFVALNEQRDELLGVARLNADADYKRAEYAVIVRSDLKGRGIGWALMRHLIDYARAEGLAEMHGEVLATNVGMLRMCRELGFEVRVPKHDASLCQVTLKLSH